MSRVVRAAAGDRGQHEGPDGMRQLMAAFPTGVGIVTAFDAEARPWGMTCTSLASVTLEPPTLLICLRKGSPTLDAVLTAGEFAMNLLHRGARSTAELFASGAPDRFDRVEWTVRNVRVNSSPAPCSTDCGSTRHGRRPEAGAPDATHSPR
ncbi:flavin reductase family protein [Streptomyces coelicoflavus]|uniref:flavin reductase family protein n=1 Tax=Streptomyces coelicoflavus TaxID=285562 RepID=UPI0036B5A984